MNILRFRTILRYILQDIYRYENFGDSNLDPHENYVFSDVYRPFIGTYNNLINYKIINFFFLTFVLNFVFRIKSKSVFRRYMG